MGGRSGQEAEAPQHDSGPRGHCLTVPPHGRVPRQVGAVHLLALTLVLTLTLGAVVSQVALGDGVQVVKVTVVVYGSPESQQSEVSVKAHGQRSVVHGLREDPRRCHLHGACYVTHEVQVLREVLRGLLRLVVEVVGAGRQVGRRSQVLLARAGTGGVNHVGQRRHSSGYNKLVHVPNSNVAMRGHVTQQAVRVRDVLGGEQRVPAKRTTQNTFEELSGICVTQCCYTYLVNVKPFATFSLTLSPLFIVLPFP